MSGSLTEYRVGVSEYLKAVSRGREDVRIAARPAALGLVWHRAAAPQRAVRR